MRLFAFLLVFVVAGALVAAPQAPKPPQNTFASVLDAAPVKEFKAVHICGCPGGNKCSCKPGKCKCGDDCKCKKGKACKAKKKAGKKKAVSKARKRFTPARRILRGSGC